jgi:TRAP-type C4-dicarboxylate transport system substrate-binding protein
MWKMKSLTTLFCIAAMLLAAELGTPIAQDKITLVFATSHKPPTSHGVAIKEVFFPRVVKYSGGRIEMDKHLGDGLCSEHTCVEQAKMGQIDIGTATTTNIARYGSVFEIMDLPYIFADDEWADIIINRWLRDELNERAEKKMGIHVLSLGPSGGFRNVANNVREARVPADMKGIKIRATKSPVDFNLIKAWGAVPVPYDWSALYQGLQSGVVNGMYIPDVWTQVTGMQEVVDYITQIGGLWTGQVVFMDYGRYQKLPDWAKKAVDNAGQDMQRLLYAIDQAWLNEAKKDLVKHVKIYKPTPKEMELWSACGVKVWQEAKGRFDPALAERLLKEQGKAALIKTLKDAGAL